MNKEFAVQRSDFDEVMVPCYAPMAQMPIRGEGSYLWDAEEKEYIDFAGGIAVSCLGHCHPAMVSALQEQSQKLWHLSNVMTNEPALQLAKRLTQASFANKVFFSNSGAEANEAALKLARRCALERHGEDKSQIIAFHQGFHGRTFFTVTAGGQACYSDGFGPKPQAITHLAYDDLEALKALISEKTCAVIMEPLQGEGGVIQPSASFLAGIRTLCDQYNALLIFDEVQTGNGRTGTLYAYQSLGITPDILTTAKSLGGGFPIGAMLTTSAIADHMKVGTHGSTYGGNPLACAVACAVLDTINDPNVLNGVREREVWFREALADIQNDFAIFSDIRGQGLLLGAELIPKWQGRAKEILDAAAEEGVLLLMAGPNVLRFTPSLIIDRQTIEQGMQRLKTAIARVYDELETRRLA